VHRLAGGRSLLDAALTMQQDRIRNSADEALRKRLARFRENLGTVEQVLIESAHGITERHLDELEGKAVDLKHHTMEEMFKSASGTRRRRRRSCRARRKSWWSSELNCGRRRGEVSSLFCERAESRQPQLCGAEPPADGRIGARSV